MLAAASVLVIIKSYSSLNVEAGEVVRIGLLAFGVSLVLCRHPGDGVWTALAVLAAAYGNGFDAGFLLVKPVAFFLIACGTFIDVMVAAFGTAFCARLSGFYEDKPAGHYI
jgi:Na+/H+-dicarboxylate symporter